jgi:hypothetical protein
MRKIIAIHGFDTPPKGPIVADSGDVAVNEAGQVWEGPRGVIKFFAWQRQFVKNLHSLRSAYNGVAGILDPARRWDRGDMASLSWALFELGRKLDAMAGRVRKLHTELGEYHGYRVEEGGPIYATPEEALEAKTRAALEILENFTGEESGTNGG